MGNTTTYTEAELVSLLKSRERDAFTYLYDHYSGALYSSILQIVEDVETGNDVLQEVFVNIWRKIETYDPGKGRLYTWMLNIARNASIDVVRSKSFQNSKKNQRLPENADSIKTGASLPETDHIGIRKLVGALKPDLRILIELAYFKGYTQEEIAAIEGIPLGTVKTRIRAALTQLRTIIK